MLAPAAAVAFVMLAPAAAVAFVMLAPAAAVAFVILAACAFASLPVFTAIVTNAVNIISNVIMNDICLFIHKLALIDRHKRCSPRESPHEYKFSNQLLNLLFGGIVIDKLEISEVSAS
jgi:hypothetical protein